MVQPKIDPELAALAQEIEGAPLLSPGAGTDGNGGADGSTSEKEGTRPDPTGAGTGDVAGEAEAKTEEEKEKETPPDPLKELKLRQLLDHPTLGPELQSWADKVGVAQVKAALERERPAIAQTERQQAANAQWDEHFSRMSQEEIGEEISADAKAASAYAQYQQRQQVRPGISPEEVERASEIYANAAQVAVYTHMLDNSGLPDEKKAELKPENFTHLGVDGLVTWGQSIGQAIIDARSEARAQELLTEKWETYKQEQLAEFETERPLVSSGHIKGAVPDLLGTPSAELLERALSTPDGKK